MRKEKLRKKQCLIIAMSILTVPFNNIHHVQATETDQQYRNLEKLCLVWGYTKYRHPVFLSGQKDWDEELLNLIDPVSEASNDDEVNKILYEWFEGLGDTDYGTDFYDLSWKMRPKMINYFWQIRHGAMIQNISVKTCHQP